MRATAISIQGPDECGRSGTTVGAESAPCHCGEDPSRADGGRAGGGRAGVGWAGGGWAGGGAGGGGAGGGWAGGGGLSIDGGGAAASPRDTGTGAKGGAPTASDGAVPSVAAHIWQKRAMGVLGAPQREQVTE